MRIDINGQHHETDHHSLTGTQIMALGHHDHGTLFRWEGDRRDSRHPRRREYSVGSRAAAVPRPLRRGRPRHHERPPLLSPHHRGRLARLALALLHDDAPARPHRVQGAGGHRRPRDERGRGCGRLDLGGLRQGHRGGQRPPYDKQAYQSGRSGMDAPHRSIPRQARLQGEGPPSRRARHRDEVEVLEAAWEGCSRA